MSAARQHHPQLASAAQRSARAKALPHISDPNKLAIKRRLISAMAAAGVTQRPLARALGRSNSTIGRWCSMASEETMPWHVREQLRVACPRLYRELVRLEYAELNDCSAHSTADLMLLSLHATKVEGEFRDTLADALADGVIDTNERRQLMELLGRVNRKWRAKAAILSKGK